MILGVGTDIVETTRIASVYRKYAQKFINRLLTQAEQNIMPVQNIERHLAKRFAAKESIAKAIGTGIGADCSLHDIMVINNTRGQPIVEISHTLRQILPQHSMFHLSISDSNQYATATCIFSQESR